MDGSADCSRRVVVLIDMDCFYCQVEAALRPDLCGKPLAVVQYNPWKGGGIIAVNYAARALGVTRHMRGDEAKEKCPELEICSVPSQRGKADISRYRAAGEAVARVLQRFTPLLERASIDEAYLDITAAAEERLLCAAKGVEAASLSATFVVGYASWAEFAAEAARGGAPECDAEHTRLLVAGAALVAEIRDAVRRDTGIAHNKMLAKVVCGANKPNKQTVLPKHRVGALLATLPLRRVPQLGGKLGQRVCRELCLAAPTASDLRRYTLRELQALFDDRNGSWLYNVARGVDSEPVRAKFNPKSIGCCKQLRGGAALTDRESVARWLRDLAAELQERLERETLQGGRRARQVVVSWAAGGASNSRCYNFTSEDVVDARLLSSRCYDLIMERMDPVKKNGNQENREFQTPLTFLGMSVGKFEALSENSKLKKIRDYFIAGARPARDAGPECSGDAPKQVPHKDYSSAGARLVRDAGPECSGDAPKQVPHKDYSSAGARPTRDAGPECSGDARKQVPHKDYSSAGARPARDAGPECSGDAPKQVPHKDYSSAGARPTRDAGPECSGDARKQVPHKDYSSAGARLVRDAGPECSGDAPKQVPHKDYSSAGARPTRDAGPECSGDARKQVPHKDYSSAGARPARDAGPECSGDARKQVPHKDYSSAGARPTRDAGPECSGDAPKQVPHKDYSSAGARPTRDAGPECSGDARKQVPHKDYSSAGARLARDAGSECSGDAAKQVPHKDYSSAGARPARDAGPECSGDAPKQVPHKDYSTAGARPARDAGPACSGDAATEVPLKETILVEFLHGTDKTLKEESPKTHENHFSGRMILEPSASIHNINTRRRDRDVPSDATAHARVGSLQERSFFRRYLRAESGGDAAGELSGDEECVECAECGETVSSRSFMTHSDYHLAVRLRREERATERRRPPPPPPPPSRPITGYFSRLGAAATERCAQCGCRVLATALAAHRDFHEAQRLSREINRAGAASASAFAATSTPAAAKRKRLVSPSENQKRARVPSIRRFLQ